MKKILSTLLGITALLVSGAAIADDGDYDGVSGSGSGDRARADTVEECHPYPLVNGECRWPEGPDGGDSDGADAGAGDSGPAADSGDSGDSGDDGGEGEGEGEGQGED